MFLKRQRPSEEGSALIAVIGVMALTFIIAAVVSANVITATAFTTSARADVQARAGADAGIDLTFAEITQTRLVCKMGSRPGDPEFIADVTYYKAGVPQPCAGTFTGVADEAIVTSTGTAAAQGTGSGRTDRHTVVAEIDIEITPGTPNSLTFDKAVFTDGELTIATNNVKFVESAPGATDADVYTNGNYICRTQIDMQGTIRSQASLAFENSCTITGDAWSKGNVTFTSQATVRGNVFAAGTGVQSVGSGHVDGHLITNGSVTIDNGGKKTCAGVSNQFSVCGSVVALGGSIEVKNGTGIGRDALAKGPVLLGNGNNDVLIGGNVASTTGGLTISNSGTGNVRGNARVAGTITVNDLKAITGSKCASGSCNPAPSLDWNTASGALPLDLGYPAGAVNGPPRESMPKIPSTSADLAKWTGWTVKEFTATVGTKTSCQQAKEYIAAIPSGNHVVVVRNCGAPISWENETVTLRGNLAVMSDKGFGSQNGVTIKSSDPTKDRDLMWIVPSDAPGITWNSLPNGQYSPSCTAINGTTADINMGNSNFTLENVNWLVYSPCLVDFGNSATGFAGQVYAGRMGDFPMNTTMQYAPMSVPGATVPVDQQPVTPGTLGATVMARYDAAG